MKNCNETTVISRVEKIRQMITESVERYHFSFSYGYCSLKKGIAEAFSKSDELLYQMKTARKENKNDSSYKTQEEGD